MTTAGEAGRRAETDVRAFIQRMARAGNPGSGRHELGVHHVTGWILDYDPSIGGFEIQAVLDLDGVVHARREPRGMRTQTWSAAEWVARDGAGDPEAAADRFAERLEHLFSFETRDLDEPWGESDR